MKPDIEKRLPTKGDVPDCKKEKKRGETYKTCISKVLKRVHLNAQISSKAMNVLDSFINDMFEKLAFESSQLIRHSEKMTITCREIQSYVSLVLPEELAKYAMSEGVQAVSRSYIL